jgi:HEAT repeat protein
MRSVSLVAASACVALPLLATACRSPSRSTPPPPSAPAPTPDKEFYVGTPEMRARAQQQIARFDAEAIGERMDAARRVSLLGEPAVPLLLEALATHPSPRTRSMAAYTLGFIKDHRARHPLAGALSDASTDVRLEAATALLRLGDVRGFAPLIAALEDPDALVRARAIKVLEDATGDALGFRPDEEPQERAAAVARWKGWLARRYETGP